MNVSPVSPPASEFSASQRAALVKLLTDEDSAVYHAVRAKILSAGPEAAGWLRPHVLSNDPLLRRRARELVQHFERLETDTAFLAFCLGHGEEFDLEEGALLLARTEYPEANTAAYRAQLDQFADALRERVDFTGGGQEILADVNQYFFGVLGFAGNAKNYYEPQNSYLNRVIDRRTGNPISLCLAYLLLVRRIGLPVAGIGLPGHFICRYQTPADELYLDVFNGGRLMTKAHCVQYLQQGKHGLGEDFLVPVTARRLLTRMCSNLHQIYVQLEQSDKTLRLQRYLVALAR